MFWHCRMSNKPNLKLAYLVFLSFPWYGIRFSVTAVNTDLCHDFTGVHEQQQMVYSTNVFLQYVNRRGSEHKSQCAQWETSLIERQETLMTVGKHSAMTTSFSVCFVKISFWNNLILQWEPEVMFACLSIFLF